ncbi:MAG TPA: cyclic nucleotide-binding domain-containing protein [Planctomycetes bacterium]|nr:cyclic nucleotide-binding domain-containing protein [Planctomycetota bacterium]
METVLPIINKISIFAGLTVKQLDLLFKLLRRVSYKAGEVVFFQGAEPSHIYIIQSGRIKLVVGKDDTLFELVVFGQGDCFGETSVIGIQPHVATATATEDTELIVLSRQALLSIYKQDLELYSILLLNIAREACRRLHHSDEVLLHYALKK